MKNYSGYTRGQLEGLLELTVHERDALYAELVEAREAAHHFELAAGYLRDRLRAGDEALMDLMEGNAP